MVIDPLSDLVTRIRNGYLAGAEVITATATKTGERVVKVLVDKGYLANAKKEGGRLVLTLKYEGKLPAVSGIKRVSKPGVRIYKGVKDLPKVQSGFGCNILTTPKGIMTEKEARKLKVGGEIIAQIW